MSFDVLLQRFWAGEPAEVARQPILEVLSASTHQRIDRDFYAVQLADGSSVELSASGLESHEPFTGCAFHIRGAGADLVRFIFDIARAGDMVIIPTMDGAPLALLSPEQERDLPEEIVESFHPILVRSPDELAPILLAGLEGWSAYRDHIDADEDRSSGA